MSTRTTSVEYQPISTTTSFGSISVGPPAVPEPRHDPQADRIDGAAMLKALRWTQADVDRATSLRFPARIGRTLSATYQERSYWSRAAVREWVTEVRALAAAVEDWQEAPQDDGRVRYAALRALPAFASDVAWHRATRHNFPPPAGLELVASGGLPSRQPFWLASPVTAWLERVRTVAASLPQRAEALPGLSSRA